VLKVHAVELALPPLQSKELAKKPHLVKQTNEALLKLLPGRMFAPLRINEMCRSKGTKPLRCGTYLSHADNEF
jgi:hypothetical protein